MEKLPALLKEKPTSLTQGIKTRIAKLPKNYLFLLISLITVPVIIVGGYYLLKTPFFQRLFEKPEEKVENPWTPYTPAPAPLASGPQTYLVSGSTKGAPKIAEVTVDPIDPDKGSTQKLKVKVIPLEDKAVTGVSVIVNTDTQTKTYDLRRTGQEGQQEIWEGSWTLEDSYDRRYQAVIEAQNGAVPLKVTLTFR